MNAFIILAVLGVLSFVIFVFVFMFGLRTEPLKRVSSYHSHYITLYDDKLTELGAKEKWDSEYVAQGKAEREKKKYLLESLSFRSFIQRSFAWEHTVDGYVFWNEISKK